MNIIIVTPNLYINIFPSKTTKETIILFSYFT